MLAALQVITLVLVAVSMALSLAHALEFPGKLRLAEAEYRKVQTIYYPGFTFGGLFGELGGMIATAALLLVSPSGAPRWLVLAALALLLLAHALYWLITHPVNKVWLEKQGLSGAGATFFGAGGSAAPGDWTSARDRWEYSHVARAACAGAAFVLLAVAVALS